MSEKSDRGVKADAGSLRAACRVIDSMLADIKRDYAQLEQEHSALATNYKILSDQAKLTPRTSSATERPLDLDLVASQAAQDGLRDSELTVRQLIQDIVD